MGDVFDPDRHKLVAVDQTGQHLHVTLHEIKSDLAAIEASRPMSSDAAAELEKILGSIPIPADLTERMDKLEALVVSQEQAIQTLLQRHFDMAQRLNDIASAADKKLTDLEVTQSFIIRNALAKVELSKGAA